MEDHLYYICASRKICAFADLPRLAPAEFAAARQAFAQSLDALRALWAAMADTVYPLIFLGDSTLDVDLQEENHTALSTLVSERLRCPLLDISSGAYSFLFYRQLLDYLPEGNGRVLVLPWNLRTFSEEWLPRPSYGFPQVRAALRYLRPDAGAREQAAAFEDYFTCTQTDWLLLQTLRYKEVTPFFQIKKDYPAVLYYCYPQERIAGEALAIKAMLRALSAKQYRVLSYILPINYAGLQEICTEQELASLHSNIKLLSRLLHKESALFADLSQAMPAEHFDVVEHLFWQGRSQIAHSLASTLQDQVSSVSGSSDAFCAKFDTSKLAAILPAQMNAAAERIKIAVSE